MEEITLNWHSYLSIGVFFFVIFFVIYAVRIPIPYSHHIFGHKRHILLNLATAPWIGIVILLSTKSIGFQQIKSGIFGNIGIKPYGIMILFYSFAYICISLDITGIFQFLAFWVSKQSGNKGRKTFLFFFILTTIMSALTSNDVVILTGTAFLVYFTRVASIVPPTAFLISEFVSANIASMALYIGNPTNVVVSQAFGISFLTYSAWMILPTIVCILVAFLMLRIIFQNDIYIPNRIQKPQVDFNQYLLDKKGAIFGFSLLGIMLLTLIITSFTGIDVWVITLPFACVMLIRDAIYDLYKRKIVQPLNTTTTAYLSMLERIDDPMPEPIHVGGNIRLVKSEADKKSAESEIEMEVKRTFSAPEISREMSKSSIRNGKIIIESEKIRKGFPFNIIKKFQLYFPTVLNTLHRQPINILPFALGMFILIESLSSLGFIAIFARWASKITSHGPYMTIFAIGWISIILCNLVNNLPATILCARILQHPIFINNPNMSPSILHGAIFSLIIGSNLGACLTFIGSLAGLMWDNILQKKGMSIGFLGFFKWNMLLLPWIATAAFSVLCIEVAIVYK